MSLIRKMQEGSKAPTLYTISGKLYVFDDLLKEADAGLYDYISTIPKGNKHQKELLDAYSNIMNGLKDGSITFLNGRYYDSKGRYTNDSNKKKDYYGLMANYIYGLQGGTEYEAPKESASTASTSTTSTSTSSTQADTSTDSAQEAPKILDFTSWINTNYAGHDKESDSTSIAFPNINYGRYTIENTFKVLNSLSVDDLIDLLLNGVLAGKNIGTDKRLLKIVGRPITNTKSFSPNYWAHQIILSMDRRKKLIQAEGDNYIVPGAIKGSKALVYNKKDQTVKFIGISKLKYYREKLVNDYALYAGLENSSDQALKNYDEFKRFFTSTLQSTSDLTVPSLKEGGILKAQEGTNSNIFFDNEDFGYNSYLNKIWQLLLVLDWMKSHYNGDKATSDYATFVMNNVNGRYVAGINDYQNGERYTGNDLVKVFNTSYQNNGDTPNYVLFGNSEDDYNNKLNGVVYSLGTFNRPEKTIHTGDSYNKDAKLAYIDNALGALTYSRVASLTNPEIQSGLFGGWGDYWKSLGNTGAYYYIAEGDKSGRGQWIPTTDTSIAGYKAFDIPEEAPKEETPKEDGEKKDDPSIIDPTLLTKKGTGFNMARLRGIIPDLLGAGRLQYSLATNNRVNDILRAFLNPVLLQTYERFSPVVGAYGEMSLRNNQAAAVLDAAARTFTSDATLLLAGLLDAANKAYELLHQGFLADDKEIKRTSAEALARQEDNVARRTDIANKNRVSLNTTNRERAQLEATRHKLNWQSIDNYLKGIEDRARREFTTDKERKNSFDLQVKTTNINAKYKLAASKANEYILQYSALGTPITSAPKYAEYKKLMEELNAWKNAQLYKAHADIYGYEYTSPLLNKDPNVIASKYKFSKGGILK